MNFITMILLNALALVIADYLVPGIHINGLLASLLAGLSLGLVNTFLRPVLLLLTLPFTVLTLGLFILVLNTITFGLASLLVPGFHIDSFGGAFWGALCTSITGWLLNIIFKP